MSIDNRPASPIYQFYEFIQLFLGVVWCFFGASLVQPAGSAGAITGGFGLALTAITISRALLTRINGSRNFSKSLADLGYEAWKMQLGHYLDHLFIFHIL